MNKRNSSTKSKKSKDKKETRKLREESHIGVEEYKKRGGRNSSFF